MKFKTKAQAAAWVIFAAIFLACFFAVCKPFSFALQVLSIVIPLLAGLAAFLFGSMWIVEYGPALFERIAFRFMRPAFNVGDDVSIKQVNGEVIGTVVNLESESYFGQKAMKFIIECDGPSNAGSLLIVYQTLDGLQYTKYNGIMEIKNLRTGKVYANNKGKLRQ